MIDLKQSWVVEVSEKTLLKGRKENIEIETLVCWPVVIWSETMGQRPAAYVQERPGEAFNTKNTVPTVTWMMENG